MRIARRSVPVAAEFGANGLAFIESHHGEGFFMDWRSDAYPKILLVAGGAGKLLAGRRVFAVRAGACCIVPAAERHRLEDAVGRPMSIYGVGIGDVVFPSRELIERACGGVRVERSTPRVELFERDLRAMLVELRNPRRESSELQLALLARVLVEFGASGRQADAAVSDAAQRVSEYAARLEREFWMANDIDTVARSLGLSRRRFTQLFKALTGESWLRMTHRLRLAHARQLLESTRLPVRLVAFECGYRDLSGFYRRYKARFGRPPRG